MVVQKTYSKIYFIFYLNNPIIMKKAIPFSLLIAVLLFSAFTLKNRSEKDDKIVSPEGVEWSQIGHRVVGEVAESYLTCRAKKNIRKILGNESIAISSNWADFIKSDSTMNYLDPWHYINVKSGLNYTEFSNYLQQDTIVDAFTKLNFLIKELKNKQTPLDKKQMYLRLVIHIIGDIHQPMHVGRKEDLGGNRINVLWFNEPTNLHAVWDEKLITYQKLSYTEYTTSINHTDKKQRKQWQQQPMSEWLFESYLIADKLYAGITQPNQKLSYRYNYDNVDILNLQLLKGGVRLAGILNEVF
jgi:S1/P1 Nuclease